MNKLKIEQKLVEANLVEVKSAVEVINQKLGIIPNEKTTETSTTSTGNKATKKIDLFPEDRPGEILFPILPAAAVMRFHHY